MFIEKEQEKIQEKKKVTIVQWLIALIVLGLIIFTGVFLAVSERAKSRDVARVAYIKQIQAGLELYYNDFNNYPVSEGLILGSRTARFLDSGGFKDSCSGKVYLNYIPLAPIPADGKCNNQLNAFIYSGQDGRNYQINFCLGKAVGELGSGPHAAIFGEIK